MTRQNGSGPKQIGDALGQSLARLQVNIEARHRKRVEAEARPGETFEQTETRLRAEDAATFDAWFRPLVESGAAEGVLSLTAPSRFHATYLRTHLAGRLQAAVRRADPSLASVRIDAP